MTRSEFDKLSHVQISIMINEMRLEKKIHNINMLPDEAMIIDIISMYYFLLEDKNKKDCPVISRAYKLHLLMNDELYALQTKELSDDEREALSSTFNSHLAQIELMKANCPDKFVSPADRHDVIIFCLRDSVPKIESIKKVKQKQLQKYKLHNQLDESPPLAQKCIKHIQRLDEKIAFAQSYV